MLHPDIPLANTDDNQCATALIGLEFRTLEGVALDKKSRLNVAIVGCGLVAKAKHIPALKRLGKKGPIAALCDQTQTLATETAKLFHVSRTYTSLTQLLDDEHIDIVDLC